MTIGRIGVSSNANAVTTDGTSAVIDEATAANSGAIAASFAGISGWSAAMTVATSAVATRRAASSGWIAATIGASSGVIVAGFAAISGWSVGMTAATSGATAVAIAAITGVIAAATIDLQSSA